MARRASEKLQPQRAALQDRRHAFSSDEKGPHWQLSPLRPLLACSRKRFDLSASISPIDNKRQDQPFSRWRAREWPPLWPASRLRLELLRCLERKKTLQCIKLQLLSPLG